MAKDTANRKRWTLSAIRNAHKGHFFDRKTLQFFGETMGNFAVRCEGGAVYVERVKPAQNAPIPSETVGKRWRFNPGKRGSGLMNAHASAHQLAAAMLESRIAAGDIAHHSGLAEDFGRSTRRRIQELWGLGRYDCTTRRPVEIHTAHDGTRRVIIDNDRGYFDHVIPAAAAERFSL